MSRMSGGPPPPPAAPPPPVEEDHPPSSSGEDSDSGPEFSEEAMKIANEGLDSLLDDGNNVDDGLGSKEGFVSVSKNASTKYIKKRFLSLKKSILVVKKKESDRKILIQFDLKEDSLEFSKNDEDASYLGRCFTINKEKKELLRIFTNTVEEFAEWFEVLNQNKTKLDETSSGGGQKVAAEVNNFLDLWAVAPEEELHSPKHDRADGASESTPHQPRRQSNTESLHPPMYSSFMSKRGGTFKTWRKRWFVLEAFTLCYYKKQGDKRPKATVSIDVNCNVLPSVENKKIKKKRPNAFCLVTHGRTYYLDCEDNKTKSNWLFNIRKTIAMAQAAVQDYEKGVQEKKRADKKRLSVMSGAPPPGSGRKAHQGGHKGGAQGGHKGHKSRASVESRIGCDEEDTTDEEGETKEGGGEEDDGDRPEALPGEGGGATATKKGNRKNSRKKTRDISKGGNSDKDDPEERVVDYLGQAQTWNRINETNIKAETTQVEFYCVTTQMRPPPRSSKRRTSTLGSMGAHRNNSSSGSVHLTVGGNSTLKPINSSHIRVQQSMFIKESRFPPNVDLSSLKYNGIGQHPFKSNTVEKEPIAVYARACVVDCPLYGDRAIEVSLHVDDPRCNNNPEKSWCKARFTLSELMGSDNGRLRIPLVLEPLTTTTTPLGLNVSSDRYGPVTSTNRPCMYVFLSKVPYNKDALTSIVQTWGMQAQTYALRTTNQELLVAREECHEVVTTFQVPLLYLKLRAAEWVSHLKTMKERCEKLLKIFIEQDEARAFEMQEAQQIVEKEGSSSSEVAVAKKKLKLLKQELARRQSTEERSKWVIAHMQSHNKIVSQYSAAIDLLTPLFLQIPPNAYRKKCISLTFKKSADKKKSALRMLPTNLHLCWWRVWRPQTLPVDDVDYEELNLTDAQGMGKYGPGTPRTTNASMGGSRGSNAPIMSKSDNKRSSMMPPSFPMAGGTVNKRGSTRGSLEAVGEVKDNNNDSDDEEEEGVTGSSMDQNFQKSFYADGKGGPEGGQDTVYDTVTFGAPAAHILGFKKGGLRALILKRQKLLLGDDEDKNEDEEEKYKHVQWYYKDDDGNEEGPYDTKTMRDWYEAGSFSNVLYTRLSTDLPEYWAQIKTRFPKGKEAFPDSYGETELEVFKENLLAAEHSNEKGNKTKGKDEMRQDAESLTLRIEQRRDLIVCQALSALVLSFSARLEVLGNRSDIFLKQLAHVGYLFQVESLVSTHGPEQGMLDDFIEAMKELNNFSFRLSEFGGTNVDSALWKQRENLTQIRGKMAATTESSDTYSKLEQAANFLEKQIRAAMEVAEEQWYYCDDENQVQGPFPASHMLSWYPDYLSDEVNILKDGESGECWQTIGERFAHSGPFPSPSIAAVRVGTGLKEISMERGVDDQCLVTIKVPPNLWAKLPVELKQGQLIPVYPVLIQQGINEFQTIANLTSNKPKLQNVVNKRAVETYREYMGKIELHRTSIGLDQQEIDVGRQLFNDFDTVVQHESPRKKNVEIIQCAQRVTRALRGGRGICCKSAKDRTSMSLTLEQAQLLFHNEAETRIEEFDKSSAKLNIEDRTSLSVANITREYGVRIMNSKKNVGKKKFAFNSIQRKRLPKLYRPPRAVMVTGKDKVES